MNGPPVIGRPGPEQIAGLDLVAVAAGKLHRINVVIDYRPHDQFYALSGVTHGADVQVVYVIDGYDVWVADHETFGGWDLAESNLTVDEAARVLADAYMHDKAAGVLVRYDWPTGMIEDFLADQQRREGLYAELDKGSDRVEADPERRRQALVDTLTTFRDRDRKRS